MALLLALLAGLSRPALAQDAAFDDRPAGPEVRVPLNLSLVPGASIGDLVADKPAEQVTNFVALNVLGGRAARLQGVEVSGLWGAYTGDVQGVQVAGLATVAAGQLTGIQAAGLANIGGERTTGLQAAGLANIAGERLVGLQAAGLANIAGEQTFGVQAAGLANIAGEELQGIQAAGLANIGGERTTGLQAAGLASIAGEEMRGLQASGLASITGENLEGMQASGLAGVVGGEMRGLQVSGLVNVAGWSRGMQLAPVNISEENTGVPIGLVSYVRTVGVRYDAWTNETGTVQAAVRSGNRRVANYVGLGVRPFGEAAYRWVAVAGLGVEFPFGPRLYGGLDATTHAYADADLSFDGYTLLNRLRFVVGTRLSGRLALFGGPSFNVYVSNLTDGGDLAPWSVYDSRSGDTYVRMWPGFDVGLRIYGRP